MEHQADISSDPPRASSKDPNTSRAFLLVGGRVLGRNSCLGHSESSAGSSTGTQEHPVQFKIQHCFPRKSQYLNREWAGDSALTSEGS